MRKISHVLLRISRYVFCPSSVQEIGNIASRLNWKHLLQSSFPLGLDNRSINDQAVLLQFTGGLVQRSLAS